MPRMGLSNLTRKTRSTENTRARRRKERRRARRRAVQNLVLNLMRSHHLLRDLSGPPEPVPDLQQLQELEIMLGRRKTAKGIQLQIVWNWRETQNPKNTKDTVPKRRKRRGRKMKSRKRNPHLGPHLKAVQLQVLSLKVKEVKHLVMVNTLQLQHLTSKNQYPD